MIKLKVLLIIFKGLSLKQIKQTFLEVKGRTSAITFTVRSSPTEAFLSKDKGVLKICSKFTEEHPYRSAISIKQNLVRF